MEEGPLIAKLLISGFKSSDVGLQDYLNSLESFQLDLVLTYFSNELMKQPDSSEVFILFKALSSSPISRVKVLIVCLQSIQLNYLKGRSCLYFMGEIRSALAIYKPPSAFISGFLSLQNEKGMENSIQDITQALEEIQKICETLILGLFSSNVRLYSNQQEQGHLVAAELLSPVISIIKDLESMNKKKIEADDSSISVKIINYIMEKEWSPEIIAFLLGLFTEITLSMKQQQKLASKVKHVLERIDPTNTDLPSIIKQCLTMAENYHSSTWVQIIRQAMLKLPPQEASTVVFIIELAIQQRTSLCKYILSSLASLDEISKQTGNSFKYIDYILLALISPIELYKIEVMDLFRKSFFVFNSNEEIYFSLIHEELLKFIHFGGMEMRSHLILDLANFLCNSEYKNAIQLTKIGEFCFIEVFISHVIAREEILGIIFTSISQQDFPSQAIYLNILESIISRSAYILCDYTSKILDWLGFINTLSLSVALKVLKIILPLANLSPSFFDGILLLHRKLIISKESKSRLLGINGICYLLLKVTKEEVQIELLTLLRPIFNYPLEIRKILYRSLIVILNTLNKQILNHEKDIILRKKPLEFLIESLVQRFQKFFLSNSYGQFSILKCFESDEVSSFKERDSIATLIKCITLASPFSLPDQIFPLLRNVFFQLLSPQQFFSTDKLNDLYQMDLLSFDKKTFSSFNPIQLPKISIIKLVMPIYLVFCDNLIQNPNFAIHLGSKKKSFKLGIELFEIYSTLRLSFGELENSNPLNITEDICISNETLLEILEKQFLDLKFKGTPSQSLSIQSLNSIIQLLVNNLQYYKEETTILPTNQSYQDFQRIISDIFLLLVTTRTPSEIPNSEIPNTGVSVKINSSEEYYFFRIDLLKLLSLIFEHLESVSILHSLHSCFRENEVIWNWIRDAEKELTLRRISDFTLAHLAHFFSQLLFSEMNEKCTYLLIKEYLNFIQLIAQESQTKDPSANIILDKIALQFQVILSEHKLSSPRLIKAFLEGIFNYLASPLEFFETVFQQCISLSSNGELNITVNEYCRSASLKACLSHCDQYLITYDLSPSDWQTVISIPTNLEKLILASNFHLTSKLNVKFLGTCSHLATFSFFLCQSLTLFVQEKPSKFVFSIPITNGLIENFLIQIYKFSSIITDWLEESSISFSENNLKQIPKLKSKFEKFELTLIEFVLFCSSNHIKGFNKLIQLINEESNIKKKDKSKHNIRQFIQEAELKNSKKKRKRTRNFNNAFIDSMLEFEDGSDDYSDLEDFLVYKKGRNYTKFMETTQEEK